MMMFINNSKQSCLQLLILNNDKIKLDWHLCLKEERFVEELILIKPNNNHMMLQG